MPRVTVTKTYKLFIDGKFPRSESGRSLVVADAGGRVIAHAARASRKDLRDGVAAARKALEGWSGATAYLRGQVMYRAAEMLEARAGEFAAMIDGARRPRPRGSRSSAAAEVRAGVDRLVSFAGWADKFAQVLGCCNPVAGPYYNFTVPQAVGVVGVVAPDEPPLLGLISLMAPALCAGNAVVALAGESGPAVLAAAVLGEVLATSDFPPGVVNILTCARDELVPVMATHRDIDAVHAAGVSREHAATLREGAAENVKRVTVRDGVDWFDARACHSPAWIEPLVEMKTIWHPSSAG